LHKRLVEVMKTHGTTPTEVLFPSLEAFEQNYEAPHEVYHDPIDGGIKRRQRFYRIILILTALAALYQVFFQGALVLGTVISLVIGVVMGTLFFSRMTQLSWDDERGLVVPKMDIAAVVILLVYIAFVVIGDAPLLSNNVQPGTVNAATSSLVAGIMIAQIASLRRKTRDIIGPSESEQRVYSSSVDIDATAEQIWDIVTDFESYQTWNPLLTNVVGELVVDGELTVSPAFIPTDVKATVTKVDKPHHFEWEDHVPLNLLTPVFSVQLLPLDENRTRVIISESFTGPLVSVLGRRLDRQMPPLYDAMGEALAQQIQQKKV
ncbi:MAG: SRPBCC domain-containing protein, partial [Chloroflexota bacterium]